MTVMDSHKFAYVFGTSIMPEKRNFMFQNLIFAVQTLADDPSQTPSALGVS